SYGVHEVIGRLGGDEFAALSTNAEYAARSVVAARARRRAQPGSSALPPLSLSVGVAHFDPQHPSTIDELLEAAEQDMYEHKRISRIAPSSGLTPHPV
ncbi:MAG TPA: GGDEF domain-containing protein, partial [Steroidobacteraceae bacterium]|nr:GGDEF domain-containing protein [Steroidobacteraceae bacterium]